MWTISGIALVFAIIIFFFFIRNDWVHRKRTQLIHENFDEYKKLEPYNTMVFRFWVWDIKKFKRRM